MVDLKTQIDFKNLDVGQMMRSLSQYQGAVINIVCVAVSLVLVFGMFKDYQFKEHSLHTQIVQAKTKLDIITHKQEAAVRLNNFKSSFPKALDEDKIITQFTRFASARGVTISALSLGENKDMGLYDISKFSMQGVAPDYKSMILFLRDIERSEYFFIVDSWKGQGQGEISFDMDISVVRVHL